MKKTILIFIVFVVVFTTSIPVFAFESNIPDVVILSTTDEEKDGYPVLEESTQDEYVKSLINNSFMKKSLELYSMAQKYSKKNNEPFYLTFKPNSGEYGRIGFYLKKDGMLIDKTSSPYIELNSSELTSKPARLQSLTQIFPHEMGHILLSLTVPSMNTDKIGSLEMHYSDVVTDYSIAFNEGFAEHFEILSRQNEENQELKNGIYKDIERTTKVVNPLLQKAERDFSLPLRFDFYRETAFSWVGRAEGLKRDRIPVNGDCLYKNSTKNFNDAEKSILYRKMGFEQELSQKRNLQQCLSTESVISRFFYLLYNENSLSLEEHYSKILEVFNKYLGKDDKPPLIQFVKGYYSEYPQEKEKVLKVYREALGYDFTDEAIPELWLISKGKHVQLTLDQFSAMSSPLYTFNINTCETEDLMKLNGISGSEAEKILQYRNKIGYFKTVEDFTKIEGVDNKTLSILSKNSLGVGWTQEEVDKIINDNSGPNLSISTIISSYVKHLLFRTIILFLIFYIFYFFMVLRGNRAYIKKTAIQFLKFSMYALLGLLSSFFSVAVIIGNSSIHPIAIFAIIVSIIEIIKLPFFIRGRINFRDSLLSTVVMAGMVVYSLF